MLKNNKGMTLLEIMIVLAILGSLAAVLVTQINKQQRKSKLRQAKIQIGEISKNLDLFYSDCGFYPSSDQGLNALVEAPGEACPDWGPESYIKKVPRDPWNHDFIYEATDGSYELISLGEDGRDGGTGYNKDISSEDL